MHTLGWTVALICSDVPSLRHLPLREHVPSRRTTGIFDHIESPIPFHNNIIYALDHTDAALAATNEFIGFDVKPSLYTLPEKLKVII